MNGVSKAIRRNLSDSPASIGPYRVLSVLGEGGMGVVYRAQHIETGQLAAVKTARLPSAELLHSLRREIRALADIRHPAIVRIFEEGVESGLPWYAMELVEGNTLRDHMPQWTRHGSLAPERPTNADETAPTLAVERAPSAPIRTSFEPLTQVPAVDVQSAAPAAVMRPLIDWNKLFPVLELVRRLCRALAFLHGEGIVHRDLKPRNVVVRRDGTPVLMDFGLAVQLAPELSRENIGLAAGIGGTAVYMAPEQLRGEYLDARADLYSLGCILYELVTGTPPFWGPTPLEIAKQHFNVDPEPPSFLADGVPQQLDELILRLLAKERQRRIGHADDVDAALARLGVEAARAPEEPTPRPYLYRADLAGRESILGRLEESISNAILAAGELFLIGGESGVGKTRLILEAAFRANARGVRVYTGECVPVASDSPTSGSAFQPLRELLRAIADLCREKGRELTEQLLGRRGKVLAQYEPAFLGLPGQEAYPAPFDLPPEAARLRVYIDLVETISSLASEKPILLVLDDLQWADELTRGFLEFLLRDAWLPRMRLLILGTYRSEEIGSEPQASLRRLLDDPSVQRVDLGRLDAAAVGSIVGDMLAVAPPPRSLWTFLARQSEGNPFFVAEYLKTAVAYGLLVRDQDGLWQPSYGADGVEPDRYDELPLPSTIRELVARRLEDLPELARKLVEAAAVFGREAPSEALGSMLKLDSGSLLDATTEVCRRQVLELIRTGDRLRFLHDKIREVAYLELAEPARARLHAAAAQAIETLVPNEAERDLAELALHCERGGATQRARELYLAAARRARAGYSHQEAERLYRASLRLMERPSPQRVAARLELAREVLSFRGDNLAAIEELALAIVDADEARDRPGRARVLQSLSTSHRLSGSVEEARRHGEEAVNLFRELGDRASEGTALMVLAAAHLAMGRLELARARFEESLAIHREVGARTNEAVILSNLGLIEREQGRLEAAQALQLQALELHRLVGNRRSEGITLENLGSLAMDRGELDEARRIFDEGLATLREVGDRLYEAVLQPRPRASPRWRRRRRDHALAPGSVPVSKGRGPVFRDADPL